METSFLQIANQKFKEYKSLVDRTFDQLEEKDFYFQPDEVNNTIAVNITHLHGNICSRWTNILTEDGEKAGAAAMKNLKINIYQSRN